MPENSKGANDPVLRTCRNCGRPLGALPAKAPHKAFCGSACRNEWHEARRRRGRELLTAIEEKEKVNGSS